MTVRAPIIGTNTDSAETFRQAMSGLWVPASATNARTGVTSVPTLTSTGNFTATVSAFTMVIDGTSNALQAGYPVSNDAAATITITAANTQPRIDLISLQVQDNAYDASGFSQGHFVVTAGTPSGSPVAPATPVSAIPLWTVPVAANATSVVFSSATAVYPYTAAAGGIVPVRGATDKPAVANGVQYRHRLDVTPGGAVSPTEYSVDGITFTPVSDQSAASTWTTVPLASPISSGTCQSMTNGSVVTLRGSPSTISQTWTSPNNFPIGTVPVAIRPSTSRFAACTYFLTGGTLYVGLVTISPAGGLSLLISSTITGVIEINLDGVSYSL
jgi:hypothetical protein